MRSFSLLLALSLVACGGDDTSDTASTDTSTGTSTTTSTGTDTAVDGFPLTSNEQVQEAFFAAQMPSLVFFLTMAGTTPSEPGAADGMTGGGTVEDCPVVAQSMTGVTLTGGCTDAEGTVYTGSASITMGPGGGRVAYDGWGVTSGTQSLTVSGAHALSMEFGVATTAADDGLVLALSIDGWSMEANYASFDLPGFSDQPGSRDMLAVFVMTGMGGAGSLTVEGTSTYTQACGATLAAADGMDPATASPGQESATYTLTGSQVVTLTQTACGATCMTWTGATAGSGEICDTDPTTTDTDTYTATGTSTGTASSTGTGAN